MSRRPPCPQGNAAAPRRTPVFGRAEAASERRPSQPRRSREPETRSWRYPNRSWLFSSDRSLMRFVDNDHPIGARCQGRAPSTTSKEKSSASFDHFVGGSKQFIWNSDAERLRGLEIDHKLKCRRL